MGFVLTVIVRCGSIVFWYIEVIMKRVKFSASTFHKFMNDTQELDWVESFKVHGFKTYEYDCSSYPRHSLSEEEYTWFILRWS